MSLYILAAWGGKEVWKGREEITKAIMNLCLLKASKWHLNQDEVDPEG